jgi:two-component system response regulator MtrA
VTPGKTSGVPARVLIVEDDDRIRETTRYLLEDAGYIVDESPSGEDALRRFEMGRPDLVLLDVMLPGIDGFETCRRLRRTSDVPIIMLTARSDSFDVVIGLEVGADDYITKPFVPKELIARIG